MYTNKLPYYTVRNFSWHTCLPAFALLAQWECYFQFFYAILHMSILFKKKKLRFFLGSIFKCDSTCFSSETTTITTTTKDTKTKKCFQNQGIRQKDKLWELINRYTSVPLKCLEQIFLPRNFPMSEFVGIFTFVGTSDNPKFYNNIRRIASNRMDTSMLHVARLLRIQLLVAARDAIFNDPIFPAVELKNNCRYQWQ